MSWEQLNKTHLHLTLESMKLLNHMNKYLLKHNNTILSLYVEKLVMHIKQAQCDQVKWNKTINYDLTIQAITIE